MLPKAPAEVAIDLVAGDYNIGNGLIHAVSLNGPRFYDRARPIRTALFLHGGRLGANHTLVERPARWLIARDLFDQVILPDRRGAGASTVLARTPRLEHQAEDMRRLLDRMNIGGPLTALGLDTGGPAALTLAGLDPRVGCVVLLASGFARARLSPLADFLRRIGLLRVLLGWEIRRSIGRSTGKPVTFDPVYDAHSPREMADSFREALKYVPAARESSLAFDAEVQLDPSLVAVSDQLALSIPVLQLIGEVDEYWGGEIPATVLDRFPAFQRRVVKDMALHNDVFFKAEAYYNELFDFLKEACPLVR